MLKIKKLVITIKHHFIIDLKTNLIMIKDKEN